MGKTSWTSQKLSRRGAGALTCAARTPVPPAIAAATWKT
jgi:hypothetical protein